MKGINNKNNKNPKKNQTLISNDCINPISVIPVTEDAIERQKKIKDWFRRKNREIRWAIILEKLLRKKEEFEAYLRIKKWIHELEVRRNVRKLKFEGSNPVKKAKKSKKGTTKKKLTKINIGNTDYIHEKINKMDTIQKEMSDSESDIFDSDNRLTDSNSKLKKVVGCRKPKKKSKF